MLSTSKYASNCAPRQASLRRAPPWALHPPLERILVVADVVTKKEWSAGTSYIMLKSSVQVRKMRHTKKQRSTDARAHLQKAFLSNDDTCTTLVGLNDKLVTEDDALGARVHRLEQQMHRAQDDHDANMQRMQRMQRMRENMEDMDWKFEDLKCQFQLLKEECGECQAMFRDAQLFGSRSFVDSEDANEAHHETRLVCYQAHQCVEPEDV